MYSCVTPLTPGSVYLLMDHPLHSMSTSLTAMFNTGPACSITYLHVNNNLINSMNTWNNIHSHHLPNIIPTTFMTANSDMCDVRCLTVVVLATIAHITVYTPVPKPVIYK